MEHNEILPFVGLNEIAVGCNGNVFKQPLRQRWRKLSKSLDVLGNVESEETSTSIVRLDVLGNVESEETSTSIVRLPQQFLIHFFEVVSVRGPNGKFIPFEIGTRPCGLRLQVSWLVGDQSGICALALRAFGPRMGHQIYDSKAQWRARHHGDSPF